MTSFGRTSIIAAAHAGLAQVLALTDAHPGEGLGDAYLGRTSTDVLAHLHAWHELFRGWLAADRLGEPVAYPAQGYTWNDLDALNESLYAAHAGQSYSRARDALVESHDAMVALIATIPDSDLVDESAHEWLRSEPLGRVAHECLGAHYEWAIGILHAAGLGAVE